MAATPAAPSIGILAGGGSLPLEIAQRLRARGVRPFLLLIEGEADADFSAFDAHPINWGAIGAMIRSFKQAGCREILLAGRVHRPDLTRIRPDLGFFRALPTILRLISAGGDDRVLRGVIGYFEAHGLRVVGPADVAPELLAREGALGAVAPDASTAGDIQIGFSVIRGLGPFDVGQAVVINGGEVAAIEGAEGTDAMLQRLIDARGGDVRAAAGVLVKRAKPGQELRVDLPAIGPDTIRRVVEAGLAGIAVEARRTLLIDAATTADRADAAGVFVQASAVAAEPGEVARGRAPADTSIALVGGGRLAPRLERDARKGLRLMAALAPWFRSRGAVVSHGHVLAVEAGEGILPLLSRAARLRQWGARRWRPRDGVMVLAGPDEVTGELITAAAQSALAAVVVGATSDARADLAPLAELGRRHGLSLAIVSAPPVEVQHGR